ncbi:MAG: ATP synthase F0 subunit B [Desulfovibrio sp.]|nr:ATP synthase F0 subunit B [Desulfovibrio sp.]
MLDLNITLLFQLVNFFIAVYLLNVLLVRPVRQILKRRQQIVDDMSGEAETFESQAEKSLADYDAALKQARQEAAQARLQGREQGQAEQQSLVAQAQKEARSILDQARVSLQKEADDTLAALRAQAGALSEKLADRLIKG